MRLDDPDQDLDPFAPDVVEVRVRTDVDSERLVLVESEVRATRKHRESPGAKPLSPAAKPGAKANPTDALPKSEAERDLLNALLSER